jgi:hypothetical protein
MNFVHFVLLFMMQWPVTSDKIPGKLKFHISIAIIYQINQSISELFNESKWRYFELDSSPDFHYS